VTLPAVSDFARVKVHDFHCKDLFVLRYKLAFLVIIS